MRRAILLTAAVVFTLILGAGCQQKKSEPQKIEVKGGSMTLKQLGEVQPGLGILMMEIGQRASAMSHAAKAENWDLVTYEIDELREAAKVGTITRPERKEALDKFLDGPLADVEDAAKEKDLATFQPAFDNMVKECNACHVSQEKAFIVYQVSKTPPQDFSLTKTAK